MKIPKHYKDWASLDFHNPEWDSRTRFIASKIKENSSVMEFGAGRRQLERYLPAACKYIPSDLESRGPDTFVCDLNLRPLPPFPLKSVDVVVFGGVLEYLRDVTSVVEWFSEYATNCIASYVPFRSSPDSANFASEQEARTKATWVNSYNVDELITIFEQNAFSCVGTFFHDETSKLNNGQQIFLFKKIGFQESLAIERNKKPGKAL